MVCQNCKGHIEPRNASLPCPKCGSMERFIHINDTAKVLDAGETNRFFYKDHPKILVSMILLAFIGIYVGLHLNVIFGVILGFIDLALFFILPHWREERKEISKF